MKLAIIGTRGIPARYGGFETLAESFADYLSGSYDITVFCSSYGNSEAIPVYKGCKLEYISFKANGYQSIFYDIASIFRAINSCDRILILGVSGGIIMPFLKKHRKKFILNIGGLDWKRSKWNYFVRKFLKMSEYLAVRFSDILIADNEGICRYLRNEYGRDSVLIAYGGDQAKKTEPTEDDIIRYGFIEKKYAVSLSRVQKDNNVEMILDAFLTLPSLPIVFIGDWGSSKYGITLKNRYSSFNNIILIDAVYDLRELNVLRSNAYVYIHGHSAGGTNPSLVEAMNMSLPVIAFSSDFNRFTTCNKALYFNNSGELNSILKSDGNFIFSEVGNAMLEIARGNYTWKIITERYSALLKT